MTSINNSSIVTNDPSRVDGHAFDYVVVGGGLTGLTIAARLSENTHHTVLVIEAGNDDRTDGRTLDIYRYARQNSSFDALDSYARLSL
jgi:choline dehydrogenase